MKSFKAAILGSLVGGSLLLLSVPSQAAPWGGRFNHGTLGNDIRRDRVTGKPHRYAFLSQAIMKHQRRLSVLIDVCCSETRVIAKYSWHRACAIIGLLKKGDRLFQP